MANLKFADTHNMVAFLSKPAEKQFWSTVKAKTINGEVQLHTLVDGNKIIITESIVRRVLQLEDAEGVDCLPNATIFEQLALMGKPKRKDTQIPQSSGPTKHVADEVVYKELDDSLVRAATTTSSLEAEQDSETMGDTVAQTRFENVSKLSNDPLIARVLDLEKTKTTQAEEIVSLKGRVNKLEQKKRSRTHRLKRINAIDDDEDITLVNDKDDADMFDVNTLTADDVLAKQEVAAKDVNLTVDEVTLAQALAALKSVKPKVKANVVEEPSVPVSAASTKVSAATTTTILTPRKGIVIIELGTSTTTTTISSQPSHTKVQDKGKGILVEEPVKPKKKDLIRLDEEIASKLQA
ncbi:hypothetical protein Tco_1306638 [Tanacetum coccineum]